MRFLDMRHETARTAKFLLVALFFAALAGCTPETDDDFSLARDKYLGSWQCQDSDGAGYHATISTGSSDIEVVVNNFFDLRGRVTAVVTEGTITVNKQIMQGIQGTYHCEGFGRLTQKSGTHIIYWEKYIANDDDITSTFTKQ